MFVLNQYGALLLCVKQVNQLTRFKHKVASVLGVSAPLGQRSMIDFIILSSEALSCGYLGNVTSNGELDYMMVKAVWADLENLNGKI